MNQWIIAECRISNDLKEEQCDIFSPGQRQFTKSELDSREIQIVQLTKRGAIVIDDLSKRSHSIAFAAHTDEYYTTVVSALVERISSYYKRMLNSWFRTLTTVITDIASQSGLIYSKVCLRIRGGPSTNLQPANSMTPLILRTGGSSFGSSTCTPGKTNNFPRMMCMKGG